MVQKMASLKDFIEFMDEANNMLDKMYEYQKKNNITRQCVTNAQYFRDCLFYCGIPTKTTPMFILFEDKISVHMVVVIGKAMFDPSYEFASKDVEYFTTYKEVLSEIRRQGEDIKWACKDLLKEFLEFVELARKQNEGDILVADKDYYNAQADYVEGKHQ